MFKKLGRFYKNTRLSLRVILSMNFAIFFAILIISVLATINRINVQKNDARNLIENEFNQVFNLLNLSSDNDFARIEKVIENRILYETGYITIFDEDGNVLIDRTKGENANISSTELYRKAISQRSGEFEMKDPVTGKSQFHYFTYHPETSLYITAHLDRFEFITKPVYNTLRILAFAMVFTWITFSLVNYFIMKSITTPIHGLVRTVEKMGKGMLPDSFDYKYKDEVGQMSLSVNNLLNGLKSTAIFAQEIGKNNFDHSFQPLSEEDVLGNALIEMKESLQKAKKEEEVRKVEDEKRNWTTQGLAKFADILRKNNDNIKELSYNIIKNLVNYLEINQGGIFILNDDNLEKNDRFLELTACYAFDRRKYLEKKILPGEGLVGTCFLEKEPIYLTQIPQDYIRITSGLGDENPSALLLIPLKVNEEIFGVIELASFKPFEKYQLEFVEKIGESIASTISSVKINTQTAMLLQKSQQQAEEMRAQEEEMRQNMEELTATQEAMADKEKENLETIEELNKKSEEQLTEVKYKEKELLDTLENCPDSVVKSDRNGKILFFNAAAEKMWGFNRDEVLGHNVKVLMSADLASGHDKHMQRYHETGEKRIIGIGREVEITTKNSQTISVFLTLVETRAKDEVFFTGFFTPLQGRQNDANKHNPTMPPDKNADPDEDNQDNHENYSGMKDSHKEDLSDSSNLNDLYDEEQSDNQKAWSDHISEKGKNFKKGRKK